MTMAFFRRWAIACIGSNGEALKRKELFHRSRTGTSSKSVSTNMSYATDTSTWKRASPHLAEKAASRPLVNECAMWEESRFFGTC